ncbi:MAG: hypothetical protein AB1801_23520 [Chloroflexota bacterium]
MSPVNTIEYPHGPRLGCFLAQLGQQVRLIFLELDDMLVTSLAPDSYLRL